MQEIKHRWSPTLGELEGTAESVWWTTPYNPVTDSELPCVFFGVYGLPDFYTLWRHRGKKYILWAGSDITHFKNGYWLDELGAIRLDPKALAEWININCESWVENEVERKALQEVGIGSQVCPSFMGNIDDYPITFEPSQRPKVYLSVSGDNFDLYGWNLIEEIAGWSDVDFHLYGNKGEWVSRHKNVHIHGRVPKEQMNEEIQGMQSGLRLNEFDGFSEVLAKSVLWGQYPIARAAFGYVGIDSFNTHEELVRVLNQLKNKTAPNPARVYYKSMLNRYPWNQK